MKGRCIDSGAALNLEPGKEYFLFPASSSSYYVSNFDNAGANFGCYQSSYFETVKPGYSLAVVTTPTGVYKVGDRYIVGPSKHPPYFDVYLLDGRIVGSYIDNFMEILEPCELPKWLPVIQESVPKQAASVPKEPDIVPQLQEKIIKPDESEQLTLF